MTKKELEYIKGALIVALNNTEGSRSPDLYNMACNSINTIDEELVKLGLPSVTPTLHKCKYVKRDGESCTLNNNCKYPNCNGKTTCVKLRCVVQRNNEF